MNGKIIINKNILITVAIVVVLLIGGIVAWIIWPPEPPRPPSHESETEVSLNGVDVGINLNKKTR